MKIKAPLCFLPLVLVLVNQVTAPPSAQAGDNKKKNTAPPSQPVAQAQPVSIRIFNFTGGPLEVTWKNPNGRNQNYGSLPPLAAGDAPTVIQTYSGHNWEFKSGGKVVQSFTAGNSPSQDLQIGTSPTARNNPTQKLNIVQPPLRNIPATPTPTPIVRRNPGTGTGTGTTNNPATARGLSAAIQEFLQVHNDARARVGAPPLRWSVQLAAYAQAWADQIAASGQFRHRPQTGAVQYGENIFGGSAGFSPADAARNWLEERPGYRGGPFTQQIGSVAGHYTQMVWSTTTEVGYGIATGPNGVVVVGNYSPAGNFLGVAPY